FIGKNFDRIINWWMLKNKGLLAWKNIWEKEEIVKELVGKLKKKEVGEMVLDLLENKEKLEAIRNKDRKRKGLKYSNIVI
ncbi:MAG: hypothetical protein AN483_21015, partial [Aphanizomenon flos-aquae MDT14a]